MPEPARIQSDWGELRAARDEPQRGRPELVEGTCHLQSRSLALKSDRSRLTARRILAGILSVFWHIS